MTMDEFNGLRANGSVPCPHCGGTNTEPYPNCGCPPNDLSPYGTKHINKYHHSCPEPSLFFDASDDEDVIEYLKNAGNLS